MEFVPSGICHFPAAELMSFSENALLAHQVSYCDRSMLVMQGQQFALKAYSSYTPGTVVSKLGRKHRGDLLK